MHTLSTRVISILALLTCTAFFSGCQSVDSKQTASASKSGDKLRESKEKDYEKLLQEWNTLKPGISRLLVIEEELNALLGELENLQASLSANASPTQLVSRPVVEETPATVTQVATVEIAEPVSVAAIASAEETVAPVAESIYAAPIQVASNAGQVGNYALQVASITQSHKLVETWQNLVGRNPQLLENLEPNFQKIQVKNTDYYRLKIGSFASLQEASSSCSRLKSAGVSCLVVDYTSSNFSQLTNQMVVAR